MTNIATYDQLLAQANAQLTALGGTVRALTSWRGEVQAMADTIAMLNEWHPSEVVSVLAVAVLAEARRLNEDTDGGRDGA